MQLSSPPKASTAPAELARQLTGFFRYVTLASDGDFLHEVAELDLSLSQLKILSLLYEQSAPSAGEADYLSVKEVAERLGISFPAASRALDPFVKRRLIARREDAEDRRVKRVRLTARGAALVERLYAIRVASFETMLDGFSDSEREKLGAALEEILARAEISRYCPRKVRP
jgi:DNA-binding MarR family transcriptional regulator